MFRLTIRKFNVFSQEIFEKSVKKLQAGELKEAYAGFDELLKINPSNFILYSHRGTVLHLLGKYEEGIKDFSTGIPNFNNQHEIKSTLLYQRASCYYELKKYEEALKDLNESAELNSNAYVVYELRGKIYSKLLEMEKAFDDFDRMISIEPESAMPYYLKGKLYNSVGRLEEAIEQFDMALEIDLTFIECCYEKGKALLDLGKTQEAIEEFSNGINLSKNTSIDGYILREYAYRSLGEHEIADADKEQVNKLSSQND
eukprot:gene3918-7129_t